MADLTGIDHRTHMEMLDRLQQQQQQKCANFNSREEMDSPMFCRREKAKSGWWKGSVSNG